MMEYETLELEIGPGNGREYPITARSIAGEAHAIMQFPLDELALDNRLLTLQNALLRSGGQRRRILSPEQEKVQQFGQELFDALITGEIRLCYERSEDRAQREGKGLRVQLRIQPPEMATLPWEFMYDSHRSAYLALSPRSPVIRYMNLPRAIEPLKIEPPLRMLGMIANPQGVQLLDTHREKERLERAIAPLRQSGQIELTWTLGETWRDLQRAMRSERWHMFHFIGHGGFNGLTDEGFIVLADEQQQPHLFPATQLAELLTGYYAPRLVLLNACDGAQGGKQDIFSSTAAILIRRGIPAVVAMQYDITDRAAIEFSHSFYEAVATGVSVETAIAEARKAIWISIANSFEWGTPVLYTHAPDGVLFTMSSRNVKQQIQQVTTLSSEKKPETPRDSTTQPVEQKSPSVETGTKLKTEGITPVRSGRRLPAWLWTLLLVVVVAGGLTLGRNTFPITLDPATILGFIRQAAATPNLHPTPTARSLQASVRATSLPTEEPIEEPTPTRRPAEEAPTATQSLLPDPLTGRLAFSVGVGNGPGGNVYTINADGSNLYQLPGEGFDREAAWSPSGDQLALTGYRNGAWGLYLIEPDGSNVRPLITNENYVSSPAWSPDGRKIAFSFSAQDAVGIYVINNDGTGLQRLTSSSSTQDHSPTWSPDGKRLAYVSPDDGYTLYSIDPDGGNRIAIERDVVGPDWSPDGQFIVYRGTPPAIFKLPVNMPSMAQLLTKRTVSFADGADLDGYPAWSPDGQAIAFYSRRSGKLGIYVMSIDGTDERLITNTPFVEGRFGERISWTQ